MHCILSIILFTYCCLSIGCVRSGLKIESIRDARNDEYPFIMRLESRIILLYEDRISAENNIHICTCVALSPSWSLTAGHCIDSAGPKKDFSDNLRFQTVVRYGSINSSTAEVLSTILHPSYHDPVLKMQNNIGLLRTEIIRLKKFVLISAIDINTLNGYEVTLAGHTAINGSLRIGETDTSVERPPSQLLNALLVRYENNNNSMFPAKCVAKGCSSVSSLCDADSGGPMLHSTGVIGINTLSLENIKLCSAMNQDGLIRMEFIIPTKPHIKWINMNVHRSDS